MRHPLWVLAAVGVAALQMQPQLAMRLSPELSQLLAHGMGLFVAPAAVASVLHAHTRVGLIGAHVLVAAVFGLVTLSRNSHAGVPWVALTSLVLSYVLLTPMMVTSDE